ncbi:MAG TPA: class I SAM-dependent methyltransferase [Bacteroidales bacterium]|nr:class I SAM-dependent methyltransferase [Bacteroidales bacterium]HRU56940.1 class I SAM-dependent methyltransferase [Bacteroidales bacterium]
MSFKPNIRWILFRIWYWYISKTDKNARVLFMNYGYHDKNQQIKIDKDDELNRYSIQLYHHLASEVEIENKSIVEIGCGRGGGLSYISKKFSPSSAVGIDLCHKAISFCKRFYSDRKILFFKGDAQKLFLNNNSCDIVINVESSHRYNDMKAFLREVYRILKPGGYFLFTDFRQSDKIEDLKKHLEISNFEILKERFINNEVIAALELDDPRKRNLVKLLAPKFLQKIALNFAAVKGSDSYNKFISNRFVYFSYVLRK